MKKKCFTLLFLCVVATFLFSISVFGEGYDNFKPIRDFDTHIDNIINDKYINRHPTYPYTQNASTNKWYYNYIKTSYELGIIDYPAYTFYCEFNRTFPLVNAVQSYSNIASIYLNNQKVNTNLLVYAKSIGLITEEEYTVLSSELGYAPKPVNLVHKNSLQLGKIATRKDIQVLTSRLFNIIDSGPNINNFTKIVDIDTIQTPQVSLEGVLQLYNLGIIVGNSYGMFTPYQQITWAEFATIVTRICVPSMRQKVDATTYEKHFCNSHIIKSYKTITDEQAIAYLTSNNLNELYNRPTIQPNDILTYSDVLTILYFINYPNSKNPNPNSAYDTLLMNSFTPINLFFSKEDFEKPITKSEAAIIAMIFATEYKRIPITITQNLDSQLISNFYAHEITYINQALSIGLLENTVQDICNTTITKADFDKMVTLYCQKFATHCAYNNTKYGSDLASLVTDASQMPNNATLYPYILNFAPKEVYEILPEELNQTPITLNSYVHKLYPKTVIEWEKALQAMVNFNYQYYPTYNILWYFKNISYLPGTAFSEAFNEKINEYNQYVIDNEIILRGDVTLLLPIVYQEQHSNIYNVRAKITFEVVQSKTDKNLLIFDENVTYSGNKFEVYVDLPATGDLFQEMAFKYIPFSSVMTNKVYGGDNIIVGNI